MSYTHETADQRNKRIRNGRIATILCVAWWAISVGGIIFVINTTG